MKKQSFFIELVGAPATGLRPATSARLLPAAISGGALRARREPAALDLAGTGNLA